MSNLNISEVVRSNQVNTSIYDTFKKFKLEDLNSVVVKRC